MQSICGKSLQHLAAQKQIDSLVCILNEEKGNSTWILWDE